MTTIKYDLPLLDRDTRFSLWQVKMRAVLAQMDLDDVLLGRDRMPASWSDEEKDRKDRKALSHIHLHLSNNILQEVLKETTASSLWFKLEQICMTKDLTSKMHLKQKLFSHKMQEGGSMLNHLSVFKEIVTDLEAMEVKYDDEDLGLILLCSLPSSYSNFRDTILATETQNIIKQDDKQVSSKRDQVPQKLKISEQITDLHVKRQTIVESKSGVVEKASELQQLIKKYITDMRAATKFTKSYSSRVLFIAAEVGNTKFLIELIRQYPDLIWNVDDNNQSIFHIAVKHRNKGIYNLLYEIGAMKDFITPLTDDHGNNMLHLVGKRAKRKQLQDVPGVALQMRQELLWFKEVETMIPPSYREGKNEDDLTPHELFTKEHKELLKESEKWMKETASQCMIVATLTASIVFAAVLTIPGGYNQNNGIPFFKSKATFMVFVVADAISLSSSSATILILLSILMSRYAERDFLESLPKKLIFGLATLFLSIATMTLAFGVSFFVLYNKGLLWVPILIGVLVVIPILLYLQFLQFRLLLDVMLSTNGFRHLLNPKKYVLYYKNPKV